MVRASLVEGKGPFSCTDGSHPEFKTNNKEEYDKHLLSHGRYGRDDCAICGTNVEISPDKLVPNGKKPVCDDCRKELAK